MIFLNNLALFWFLVFGVFVAAILGFTKSQRLFALLLWAVSLAAFHIAVVPGFLNPQRLVWLILNRRNRRGHSVPFRILGPGKRRYRKVENRPKTHVRLRLTGVELILGI